ncbi:hypothetical protein KFU94_29415 [Chloroflexi bacterium TSY]|nr:hypothetical protein [Chloroflexi bacterium TSY]
MYYHGARYYAPWLVRWVSCDPAIADRWNSAYIYVASNPIRNFDPNGLWAKDMHFAAVYWAGRMEGGSHEFAFHVALASQRLDDFPSSAAPDLKIVSLLLPGEAGRQ